MSEPNGNTSNASLLSRAGQSLRRTAAKLLPISENGTRSDFDAQEKGLHNGDVGDGASGNGNGQHSPQEHIDLLREDRDRRRDVTTIPRT